MTKSYYNENWQELESQTNSDVTSYVLGLRYVDDLVLRENGKERLYSIADPNWNVVALVDVGGNVKERFNYDAFGKRNATGLDWNRAFTGQVLDAETGLMLYRNRYYSIELGRFVTRDPIGYRGDSENLYRYVQNSPLVFNDESGYGIIVDIKCFLISESIGSLTRTCLYSCVADKTQENGSNRGKCTTKNATDNIWTDLPDNFPLNYSSASWGACSKFFEKKGYNYSDIPSYIENCSQKECLKNAKDAGKAAKNMCKVPMPSYLKKPCQVADIALQSALEVACSYCKNP